MLHGRTLDSDNEMANERRICNYVSFDGGREEERKREKLESTTPNVRSFRSRGK